MLKKLSGFVPLKSLCSLRGKVFGYGTDGRVVIQTAMDREFIKIERTPGGWQLLFQVSYLL